MSANHPNNFPKLHNAAWPGVVGKGEGSEPAIDLDTMLDLTASGGGRTASSSTAATCSSTPPISTSTRPTMSSRRWPTRPRRGAWRSAQWSPRSGRQPAAARPWTRARAASCSSSRSARAAGSRRRSASSGRGPTAWSASTRRAAPGEWAADPEGDQRRIAETFKEAAKIARDFGERLAAEGEICWGGMHSWRKMVDLLERVGEPETVGFQADMAHTLLYTLGENAPEDRILPKDFEWSDKATLDEALQDPDRRPATLDERFPRRAERRHRVRLGVARPHRPPLPRDRPQRQAGHPAPCRVLAPRRAGPADQEVPPHLLGRLHVPQCRDEEPARPGTTSSRR